MSLVDDGEPMFGFMMTVEIAEEDPAASDNSRAFFDALQMIWRATDLGRIKTTATLNAISTHQQQGEEGRRLADIKPSTCRISCGVEDVEDIIADLTQALDAIPKRQPELFTVV
jgi:cystathionine beta-lyase/cystathionine gamma-synthase